MNIFDKIVSIVESYRNDGGDEIAAVSHLLALQRLAWANMTVAQKTNLLTSKPLADLLLICGAKLTGKDLVQEYRDWLLSAQDDLEESGYRFEETGAAWIWEDPTGEASEDFNSVEDAVEDAFLHQQLHHSTIVEARQS